MFFLIYTIIFAILFRNRRRFQYTFIWTLYWYLNILFSEIFFVEIEISAALYLFLISISISLFLGEFMGKFQKIGDSNGVYEININRARTIILITSIFGIVFSIINLYVNGYSLMSLLNLGDLLSLNNQMAIDRYGGERKVSILGQVSLIFVFLTPLLVGFLKKYINKWQIFFGFLPAILVVATQNTKITLITAAFFYITGILLNSLFYRNSFPRVSSKSIFYGIIIGILFYSILLFSFVFRVGKLDERTIAKANSKFTSYLAHVPAFDNWLTQHDESINYYWGTKTFYGVSSFLGIEERKQGIFEDFYIYKGRNLDISTNIYTLFRSLIEDFGIFGSLCFLSFCSYIFTKRMILKNLNTEFSLAVMSSLLMLIFYSFVTSIYSYTSYILAFVFFYLILKLINKRCII